MQLVQTIIACYYSLQWRLKAVALISRLTVTQIQATNEEQVCCNMNGERVGTALEKQTGLIQLMIKLHSLHVALKVLLEASKSSSAFVTHFYKV